MLYATGTRYRNLEFLYVLKFPLNIIRVAIFVRSCFVC